MSILETIKPQTKERVIDLIEKAGFDVSSWADFNGHPSQNPAYCYEWAFTDPDRGIILNLWHPQFEEKDGEVFRIGSFKNDERHLRKPSWKKRAERMDVALKSAWERELPVQVIMLDGLIRNMDSEEPSQVHTRSLDSEFWHISAYNAETGDHRIVRGAKSTPSFVDQFSTPELGTDTPARTQSVSSPFVRDPKVRQWVLARAKGYCELCGEKGFETNSGRLYLETHHIDALCDGGPDVVTNVIALCPNHHREAHFSVERDVLRKRLFAAIAP